VAPASSAATQASGMVRFGFSLGHRLVDPPRNASERLCRRRGGWAGRHGAFGVCPRHGPAAIVRNGGGGAAIGGADGPVGREAERSPRPSTCDKPRAAGWAVLRPVPLPSSGRAGGRGGGRALSAAADMRQPRGTAPVAGAMEGRREAGGPCPAALARCAAPVRGAGARGRPSTKDRRP
jgi:hypothetical protein